MGVIDGGTTAAVDVDELAVQLSISPLVSAAIPVFVLRIPALRVVIRAVPKVLGILNEWCCRSEGVAEFSMMIGCVVYPTRDSLLLPNVSFVRLW